MDKKLSILLVEDDIINQRITKIYLTKYGHSVDIASNGVEALEKFISNHANYDLIFMDMQMPEMDGLECSRKIREFEQENNLKRKRIVAFTANAMSNEKEMCTQAGMDDFINKPFKIEDLLSKLI